MLYRHGWDRQRILDLFAVIDWMMRLPDALEQALRHEIQTIGGDRKMAYVTSVERLANQRGQQEGEEKGRVDLLARPRPVFARLIRLLRPFSTKMSENKSVTLFAAKMSKNESVTLFAASRPD